jgi:probable 2-oxoglutarate dehydrogenase E1 component DHKTD1
LYGRFHQIYIIVLDNVEQVILCAAHRGRLNLLTGLLNFPPEKLFRKLRGLSEFSDTIKCTGDVISHLVNSTDLNMEGKNVHVTMLRNPSHLEVVNPVSMGKTRAVMQALKEAAYGEEKDKHWSDKVINIQVSYKYKMIILKIFVFQAFSLCFYYSTILLSYFILLFYYFIYFILFILFYFIYFII